MAARVREPFFQFYCSFWPSEEKRKLRGRTIHTDSGKRVVCALSVFYEVSNKFSEDFEKAAARNFHKTEKRKLPEENKENRIFN